MTTVPKNLPQPMRRDFDAAKAALENAQASISEWLQFQVAMQAPADASGHFQCKGPGQTGRNYSLAEPGGALLVDQRDLSLFESLGFRPVPGSAPTANLRAGLVFFDADAGRHLRYDGSDWQPFTLE